MISHLLTSIILLLTLGNGTAKADSSRSCQRVDMGGRGDSGSVQQLYDAPFGADKSLLYEHIQSAAEESLVDQPGNPNLEDIFHFNATVNDQDIPQLGEVSGLNTWISNFTWSALTWFVPTESGDYTFSINDVSDGAAIYIYDNLDFLCCDDLNLVEWLPKSTQVINIPTDKEHTTGPKTLTLEKDQFYAFLMVYVNFSGDVTFSASITDPSGNTIANPRDYIFLPTSPTCDYTRRTSMVYSLGTESYTTTYSTSYVTKLVSVTGQGFEATVMETIYYVMTPLAESSSTVIPPESSTQSSELLSSFESSTTSSELITSISYSSESSSILSSSQWATVGSSDVSTDTLSSEEAESTESLSSQATSSGESLSSVSKNQFRI